MTNPLHHPTESSYIDEATLDNKDGELHYRKVVPLDKKDGCNKSSACNVLKWAVVALAILGAVVGVVGVLSYLGQLQLGLAGVGAMSATTGLYVMLGGFGLTLVTGILLTVSCVIQRARAKKEHEINVDADPKPASCFSKLCGKNKAADAHL
jgi:hypothetical protein